MDQIAILTRISHGDESAFRYLYELYRPTVYKFLLNYVQNPVLAEDLYQELFLKVWAKRDELMHVLSFKAYLYTIAKNLAINSLKRTAVSEQAIKELHLYYRNEHVNTSHQIQTNEYMRMLTEELDKLPKRSREIFFLCRQEGKTYEEVATKMGISRNAIKNHMVSTIKALKTFAKKQLGVTTLMIYLYTVSL